jgi:hypothetical protein
MDLDSPFRPRFCLRRSALQVAGASTLLHHLRPFRRRFWL